MNFDEFNDEAMSCFTMNEFLAQNRTGAFEAARVQFHQVSGPPVYSFCVKMSGKTWPVAATDLKLRPRHKKSENYIQVLERPPQGLGQLILTLKCQLLSHFP